MATKRVGRPKGSKNAAVKPRQACPARVDVVVVERSHPAAVARATLAGRRRRPAPSATVPVRSWTRSGPERILSEVGPVPGGRLVQECTGLRTDGTPYEAIIRRRCRCLDCGQVRIDKEHA